LHDGGDDISDSETREWRLLASACAHLENGDDSDFGADLESDFDTASESGDSDSGVPDVESDANGVPSHWPALRDTYVRASEKSGDLAWPGMRLAQAYASLGDQPAALSACLQAISRGYSPEDCFDKVYKTYYSASNWAAIKSIYEAAIATYGDAAWLWVKIAPALARLGDQPGALSACSQAISRGYSPEGCFEKVYQIYHFTANWAAIKSLYEAAIAMYGDAAWPLVGMARALACLGDQPGALSACSQAISRGYSPEDCFSKVDDVYYFATPRNWAACKSLYEAAIAAYVESNWARHRLNWAIGGLQKATEAAESSSGSEAEGGNEND